MWVYMALLHHEKIGLLCNIFSHNKIIIFFLTTSEVYWCKAEVTCLQKFSFLWTFLPFGAAVGCPGLLIGAQSKSSPLIP